MSQSDWTTTTNAGQLCDECRGRVAYHFIDGQWLCAWCLARLEAIRNGKGGA